MVSSPSSSSRTAWLTDGAILVAANLVASFANYLFQAAMSRTLSWSEFGYLNSTLSLIVFAAIPLAAASQTLTHHLAQVHSADDPGRIAELQSASLHLLRNMTWYIFGLCALFVYPVSEFLRYPRFSLAAVGLLWIPVILWSSLGGAWCSGLGKFRLLSVLLIASGVIRLILGLIATQIYPWAESGIVATILSGLALAAVAIFSPHHGTPAKLREVIFHRTFLAYGAASLAVTFCTYVFLQGDLILAQRYFPGDELGRYTGSGLLGRAILYGSLPLLSVYFTRRSGHDHAKQGTGRLMILFLLLVLAGVVFVSLLRRQLLTLFLGVHDPLLDDFAARFVLNMIPIGILHAIAIHCLAARWLPECLLLGICGLVYLAGITLLGVTPFSMLTCMGLFPIGAILLVGICMLARRRHPLGATAP